MTDNRVQLINEKGTIKGKDPVTGNTVPIEFGDITATEVVSDKGRVVNRIQARSTANAVRQVAGIPAGISVGVSDSANPGLAGPDALTEADSNLILTSKSEAETIASGGSGTREDPYMIRDLELDGYRFQWRDSEASYHVKLENCELHDEGTAAISVDNGVGTDATLTARNCLLYGQRGGHHITVTGGKVIAYECEFAGASDWAISLQDGVNSSDVSFEAYDSIVTESKHLFEYPFITPRGACRVVASRNKHTGTGPFFAQNQNAEVNVALSRNDISSDGTAISDPYSGVIEYNRITGTRAINVRLGEELRIEHNHFDDAPQGQRLVRIGSGRGTTDDIIIRRNLLEKPTGTGNGNEAVYANGVVDILYEENYCTTTPEDAYEFVRCANQRAKHNVADNCGKQIVDVFRGYKGAGSDAGFIVEGVYGDGTQAVKITDVNHGVVRDVHARVDGNAVVVEQRRATAGESPNNIVIEGALPLSDVVEGEVFKTKGQVGEDIQVQYIDDEIVQRPADTPRQTQIR